jgi:hypothetical protein
MKATLTFEHRRMAEKFATDWGRYSKRGHIIGSGNKNVSVTIFDVTPEDKVWVDEYISFCNQQ